MTAKLQLNKLAGRVPINSSRSPSNFKSLIAFLHGPAGSGKSASLSLLKTYASQFCDHIGEPFTEHTIVFTAMSVLVVAAKIDGMEPVGTSLWNDVN